VAGGKVLVAGVDTHTVHALGVEDGKDIWKYTVGSRVDSPPTLHDGLAVFGSADGRAYCLRAADGALVWRFDAAPNRCLVVGVALARTR
ncbi:MAG: outer membrane protein assembly factor BamB family protein, partial [Planctomycetota bacterium]